LKEGIVGSEKENPEKELTPKEKVARFDEAMGKEEESDEDAKIIAELLDEKGNLMVDLSLPEEYELEIMAQTLLGHITQYAQTKQAYLAAKNSGDHQKRQQLWQQMQYNQLTAAIIQKAYPKAKALVDKLATLQARQAKSNREQQLEGD